MLPFIFTGFENLCVQNLCLVLRDIPMSVQWGTEGAFPQTAVMWLVTVTVSLL